MSQRNSTYERRDRDFYPTPAWVTEIALPYIPAMYDRGVWEPACGDGAMVDVFKAKGHTVFGTDISIGLDFFQFDEMFGGTEIIFTNPPYEQAQKFIEHALKLTERVDGTVAMLLRADYDHASSRKHLFKDHPAFSCKIALTRRILWFKPPPGSRNKSPSENHAWYIWDWANYGDTPRLKYAP